MSDLAFLVWALLNVGSFTCAGCAIHYVKRLEDKKAVCLMGAQIFLIACATVVAFA